MTLWKDRQTQARESLSSAMLVYRLCLSPSRRREPLETIEPTPLEAYELRKLQTI